MATNSVDMRKEERRRAVRRQQEPENGQAGPSLVKLEVGNYKLRISSVAGGVVAIALILVLTVAGTLFFEFKLNRIDRSEQQVSANISLQEHSTDLRRHDTSSLKNQETIVLELRQLGWITCVSHTQSAKRCQDLGVMRPAGWVKSKFEDRSISMIPSAEAAEKESK